MRKKMYEAKKHWVIASAAALTVLGTSGLVAADETTGVQADVSREIDSASANQSVTTDTSLPTDQENQASSSSETSQVSSEEKAGTSESQTQPAEQEAASQALDSSASSEQESGSSAAASEADQEKSAAEPIQTDTTIATPANDSTVVRASVSATVERASAAEQVSTPTTSVTTSGQTMTIQYNQPIAANEAVNFAVWSEENGQDDLVWYSANAQGAAYIDLSKHRSYGTYNVHTYSVINGQNIGRNVQTIKVSPSQVNTKIEKVADGQYKVTVGNVSSDITGITLPIWTEKNGQDDIIWYQATRQNTDTFTATVKMAEHHNELGHYNVHVYGQSAITGGLVGLTATSGFDIKATDVATKAAPKNTVSANLTSQGINIHLDSNEFSDLSHIRFAFWSKEGDQDDLHWYEADGNHSVTVSYTDHSGYGTYYIHTYADRNGQAVGLNATSIEVPSPSATAKINKANDNTYTVQISNLPQYITSVTVPVWTEKNGQDDLIWYATNRNDDGSYTATVKLKDHNFESGRYNVHFYGTSSLSGGAMVGLGTSSFNVDQAVQQTDAKVYVTDHNAEAGTLRVVLNETDTSKKAKSIEVAAWSLDGQANLHWYSADVQNGSASVRVDEQLHGMISGSYTVHAYVNYQDGSRTGFNLGQYDLNKERANGYFIDVSSYNNAISVDSYRALKSRGITGVVVKLTEGNSYINPYAGSQIANAKAAGLKVSVYHFARYTNADEARSEAAYFVNVAKSYGLDSSTAMVDDIEHSDVLQNVNSNTSVWTQTMKSMGYNNLLYYTMASWLDTRGGSFSTSQVGMDNMWIAHYVKGYNEISEDEAANYNYYNNAAAWQYTSVSKVLGANVDQSIDYTGRLS
ncbi:GBS Bsp-like repeat-containing protein [Streptococcus sobrinus]|uniref:GBS Bsp-like repeat-containing protein n=3 Tax=Streptococcus sobrinus TaxID=1310 RepID=UPI0002EBA025|nr:GBS Bsp-like repeat-containing protein [Streptococcus sobrinus]